MNYMNDNEWDEFLKSKVEEFEFPYEEKYWEQLQKQLPKISQKSKPLVYWRLGILALLFTSLTLAYYFYEGNKATNLVPKNNSFHLSEHSKPINTNSKLEEPNKVSKNTQQNVKYPFKQPIDKKINAQKNFIPLKNKINERKRSAQLLILSEKISAISRTIMIYKALKLEAQNYIPMQNAEEFVKKLVYIDTKNLFASKPNQELNNINQELQKTPKKDYFEKRVLFGSGCGFYGSKYSKIEDLYFRQWIAGFIQYQFSPLFYVQLLPQMSFGNHLSLNNKKSQPLALHLPFETGVQWKRYSISTGFAYDYFFLHSEQKQELNSSRTLLSISFQSQYQQFMLRLNTQFALNDATKLEAKHQEFRFSIGLYYIIPNK